MGVIKLNNLNLRSDRTLLPQQEDAVQFMLHRTSAIVSLSTGLGKTFSSLTAMEHLKLILKDKLLTIILAPTNAIISFNRELEDFGYSYNNCIPTTYFDEEDGVEYISREDKIYDENGVSRKIGRMLASDYDVLLNDEQTDDIIVSSYSKIGEYLDDFMEIISNFRRRVKGGKVLLIIDEAHTLSNSRTTRTANSLTLRKMCDIVWALTATPVKNDYEGIFHLCNFVRPGHLAKNKTKFIENFCETQRVQIYGRHGKIIWVPEIIGRKNEEQLKELLEDLILYREIKYDIKYHYIGITLNDDEIDMYDEVASDRLMGGGSQFSNRIIELQKLLDNTLEFDIVDSDGNVIMNKSYKFTTKENKLMDTLDKLIAKKQTPIIYTDFVDTVERLYTILTSKGYRVHKIDGRTNSRKRKNVEDTMEVGDITIITSAGTASLNLQKANVMVFYNVPFSSVNVIQSIGRITRLGSSYTKQHVIFLYCMGTVDEYKIKYFKSNASMFSKLIGKSSNLPDDLEELDDESFRDLKAELLWQYKTKKNSVRRMRRNGIRTRLIVVKSEEVYDGLNVNGPILNLSGKDVNITVNGKDITSKSTLSEFNNILESFSEVGFYKSRLREYLRDGYVKLRKVYFLITREAKEVYVLDSDYKVGKLMKDFLVENWRYFEEKL